MAIQFNAGGVLEEVYFNGIQMEKVYFNGTLVYELATEIVCTPSSVNDIGSTPYTTVNINCDKAGDLYIDITYSLTPSYFELEWYLNDSYQGYILVWDDAGGGQYYEGPNTISVNAGDDVKFRVNTNGFAAWEMRDTDASGVVVFTGYVEKA